MFTLAPPRMIPKHWRFGAPLLMGHLKKSASGHLLRTESGHLVNACTPVYPNFCCIAGTPAFVPATITIPTLSGCCAKASGTYVLSQIGLDACYYGGSNSPAYTPCSSPADCSDAFNFFYLINVSITVTLGTSTVAVVVTCQYERYFAPCTLSTLPSTTWNFSGDCATDAIPFVSGDTYPPASGAPTCYPASVTLA